MFRMTTVLLLAWLICGIARQSPAAVVLQTATFGASTYSLLGSTADGGGIRWSEAEAYASSLGAHLATIESAEENDFLFNTFGAAQFGSHFAVGGLYIGLTDQGSEGTFLWSSGIPVTYTNWALGEPTNTHNREDWVMISVKDSPFPFLNGAWNDVPNIASGAEVGAAIDSPAYAIMEVAAPEPSAFLTALLGCASCCLIQQWRMRSALRVK